MKKLVLAFVFVIGSMGYVVIQRGLDEQGMATTSSYPSTAVDTSLQTSSEITPVDEAFAKVQATAQEVTNVVTQTSQATKTTKTTPKPVTTPTPTPVIPPVKKGQYSDGTFTGSSESQPYGTVQVAVVVSNGRIVNVKLLQTPNHGGTTKYINEQALPMLIEETLQAQSGNIDGISGASLTSPAYIDSLNSALTKARA